MVEKNRIHSHQFFFPINSLKIHTWLGFSSIGASFAGAPGTIIGHNDYFAWGTIVQ